MPYLIFTEGKKIVRTKLYKRYYSKDQENINSLCNTHGRVFGNLYWFETILQKCRFWNYIDISQFYTLHCKLGAKLTYGQTVP